VEAAEDPPGMEGSVQPDYTIDSVGEIRSLPPFADSRSK
jgi:hypothetical protein